MPNHPAKVDSRRAAKPPKIIVVGRPPLSELARMQAVPPGCGEELLKTTNRAAGACSAMTLTLERNLRRLVTPASRSVERKVSAFLRILRVSCCSASCREQEHYREASAGLSALILFAEACLTGRPRERPASKSAHPPGLGTKHALGRAAGAMALARRLSDRAAANSKFGLRRNSVG
jgi:hypothetical protein